MEGVAKKGMTKAIGISNFTITKTENLLKTAKIVPAVNQVECHPFFQQQKLKEYCDSKGFFAPPFLQPSPFFPFSLPPSLPLSRLPLLYMCKSFNCLESTPNTHSNSQSLLTHARNCF